MSRPGPKPRPYLAAVREGNPGHKKLRRGMVLSGDLAEPDWATMLPGPGEMTRVRRIARETWRRLAPALTRSAGLSGEMTMTLQEYCVCVARIDQGERSLSRDGVLVRGPRGTQVRNPWGAALNQYRSHLRSLTGELGLSPSSAGSVAGADVDDEDDPFD